MTFSIHNILLKILRLADWLLVVPIWISARLMKLIRRRGVQNLPICKKALLNVGVFPIRNHFYEPQFDHRLYVSTFSDNRDLPGLDWTLTGQLTLLAELQYAHKLKNEARFLTPEREPGSFYIQKIAQHR